MDHIKQLYYNRLTNNRIKSIALGTLTIIILGLFILIINRQGAEPIRLYQGVAFGFLLILSTYLVALIPFGQVLESADRMLTTYYKLGRLKFSERKWGEVEKVSLVQNKKKYYCLTINLASGQIFQVEKYSTLNEANERLTEVKKLFD